ncbi:MAG: HAD hydrolase family protein [Coriobacteriia bacterium]|nr:HAD hydrolase family protein [Coriobacteriia bacterium]
MSPTVPYLDESTHARETLARASVLYTDLDGTLVAKGGSVLADAEGAPSTATAEAIVAVNRAGLDVVPVSGRNRLQLRELTQLLGWRTYIAEAGAIIVRGTDLDAEIVLDIGDWREGDFPEGETPFEIIVRSGALEALISAFPGRIEHFAPWQLDREVTLLLRGCLDTAEAQAVLDTVRPPLDLIDNGQLRSYGTLTCRDMAPHAYHVVPRGVCKARAIALDLASRGLSQQDAIAIGDSATDTEMASAVSAVVLVDNAFESPGVLAELERRGTDGIFRARAKRSEGWAEFANAWLDARST